MPRTELKEFPEQTVRVRWQCRDCLNEGSLVLRLPLQGRWFLTELEEHHRKVRGPVACPSNYFSLVEIKS